MSSSSAAAAVARVGAGASGGGGEGRLPRLRHHAAGRVGRAFWAGSAPAWPPPRAPASPPPRPFCRTARAAPRPARLRPRRAGRGAVGVAQPIESRTQGNGCGSGGGSGCALRIRLRLRLRRAWGRAGGASAGRRRAGRGPRAVRRRCAVRGCARRPFGRRGEGDTGVGRAFWGGSAPARRPGWTRLGSRRTPSSVLAEVPGPGGSGADYEIP